MAKPDLNLLATLDVLLAEGSVARAARRLRLSPSAMSRALARLRAATGDSLLVRAGSGLVLTPRALELRARVSPVLEDARGLLRPSRIVDPTQLDRTFTLRVSEGFVEAFGAALITEVTREAPAVRLIFAPRPDRESGPLREGAADLEIGVVGRMTGPELRTQALFRDRFVGVVRRDHHSMSRRMTLSLYAGASHIGISRHGPDGPIDVALAQLGRSRSITVTVAGFPAALALARESDLVATVPARFTAKLRDGMRSFTLPMATPEISVSLLWHPRQDTDPALRWLRARVRAVCTA
jgi:DNA-binding transcriptional LysR family regulator